MLRNRVCMCVTGIMLGLVTVVVAQPAPTPNETLAEAKTLQADGKHEEALAKLEPLQTSQSGDPRVPYLRAVSLKELKRDADAVAAIRQAVSAFEARKKAGEKDPAILGIKSELDKLAADLLRFRRLANRLLTTYRQRLLKHAAKLLEQGKDAAAAFVCDELRLIVAPDDAEVAALNRKIDRAFCETGPSEFALDSENLEHSSAALDKQLEPAEKALSKKKWDDAKSGAEAVLKERIYNQRAWTILAEAFEGLAKPADALAAALLAVNAVSEPKETAGLERRLQKILRTRAPQILEVLKLRTTAAKDLLRLRADAEKLERGGEAQWLADLAAVVAPASDDVQKALGGTVIARLRKRADWAKVNGPTASSTARDEKVDALLDEADALVQAGEELVAATKAAGFDNRKLKDTLQQALNKYEAANAKYRDAQKLAPTDDSIEDLIVATNQKIYWTRKSMPLK